MQNLFPSSILQPIPEWQFKDVSAINSLQSFSFIFGSYAKVEQDDWYKKLKNEKIGRIKPEKINYLFISFFI